MTLNFRSLSMAAVSKESKTLEVNRLEAYSTTCLNHKTLIDDTVEFERFKNWFADLS